MLRNTFNFSRIESGSNSDSSAATLARALDPRLRCGAVIQRAGDFNVLRDLAESARLENVCVLLHAEHFVLA
jgi:hypothetical protein